MYYIQVNLSRAFRPFTKCWCIASCARSRMRRSAGPDSGAGHRHKTAQWSGRQINGRKDARRGSSVASAYQLCNYALLACVCYAIKLAQDEPITYGTLIVAGSGHSGAVLTAIVRSIMSLASGQDAHASRNGAGGGGGREEVTRVNDQRCWRV